MLWKREVVMCSESDYDDDDDDKLVWIRPDDSDRYSLIIHRLAFFSS